MEQSIKANKCLGARIRSIRKQKGLTQGAITIKMQLLDCDMSRGTYAKIEAGIRHVSVSELALICKILEVDYNTLFQSLEK